VETGSAHGVRQLESLDTSQSQGPSTGVLRFTLSKSELNQSSQIQDSDHDIAQNVSLTFCIMTHVNQQFVCLATPLFTVADQALTETADSHRGCATTVEKRQCPGRRHRRRRLLCHTAATRCENASPLHTLKRSRRQQTWS